MSKRDEEQMDQLADLVSGHGSIARAARTMKVDRMRADYLWMRIRARLGEQAR